MALDDGGEVVFKKAGLAADSFVLKATQVTEFIKAAKTRLWTREASVRTLA